MRKRRINRIRELLGVEVEPQIISTMNFFLKAKVKGRIIARYMKDRDLERDQVYFFDDDPNNIRQALDCGVRSLLVETSYNVTEAQRLRDKYPDFESIRREYICMRIKEIKAKYETKIAKLYLEKAK